MSSPDAAAYAQSSRTRTRGRRRSPAYDFIAGALFLIVCFHVVPCLWGIALSFFRYDGIGRAEWIGLDGIGGLGHGSFGTKSVGIVPERGQIGQEPATDGLC